MKKIPLLMILLTLALGARAQSPTPRYWDLAHADQDGQITLYDGPAYASTTGKPNELGDFNGNGCGDLAMTGQNARGGAGQVRVVFDLCDRFGSAFDFFEPDENTPSFLNIWGPELGAMFGTELVHADLNADGIDDLIVSAQNAANPLIRMGGAGAVYIFFGADSLHERSAIDLAAPPDDVLILYGPEYESRLGMWVESGDFDGDGVDDVIIGANQADGPSESRRPNAGMVYVLYGAEDLSGGVIDLSQPHPDMTRILGPDSDDLLGSTVYGADLNRDGVDDLIMSAALWRGSAGVGGLAQGGGDGPANTRYNTGDTYILFGSSALRGQMIDLATLLDADGNPIDEALAVVYGPEANDFMGEEIVVGDLNGDGWNDLVVGSLATPGRDNRRVDGGEAWVIYGGEHFAGSAIDLAEEGAGVPIYAAESDSKGGDTMLIGDMDGDGIGDLLYGAPNGNYEPPDQRPRINNGLLYILYGASDGFPTTDGLIDLADPPLDLRYDVLIGADSHDMSIYGVSIGDINNDGWPDISLNGMNGDGPDNRRTDSGEVYLIDGATLAAYDPTQAIVADEPTEAPEIISIPETPTALPDLPTEHLSAEEGATLYQHYCAGCHGANGEGVAGIGYPFLGDSFVADYPDAELLAFIRVGRSAGDADSKMGRVMPPSGGNPALTDAELLAIITHIRGLGE